VAKSEELLDLPEIGSIITGQVIDKARNALYVDLGVIGVGVIYGRELMDEAEAIKNVKIGDAIQATVQKHDNEDDYIELSLSSATRERSWGELNDMLGMGEILETEILDANRGGLIVRVRGVTGFLPVSQLAPDHYPRVDGGDRGRILERLKEYVGSDFKVKVIAAEQETEKLIVSEKAALSDEMSSVLDDIKEGEKIKGTVSGIVEFGVFVKFVIEGKELEGLVHISELAWQRVDDPQDFVSVGDEIEAKIIGVDGLRISLSFKQLQEDPWKSVDKKYKVDDKVKGEVIKVTPFGGFVKLDDEIHGLVHLSELPEEAQTDPASVLKVGETMEFVIVSIESSEHRLGLSLGDGTKKTEEKEEKKERKEVKAKKKTKEKKSKEKSESKTDDKK